MGTDPQRSQHLLVAVCDECDQMVGLPAQSTPNAAVAPSQALIPTATTTSMFSDREIEESLAISALAKAAMDSPREHELTAEELDVEGELIKCSLGLQCGTH
ncbi:MAG: hypothetical protein RSG77_21780 [Hafnia sp.]